MNSEAAILEQDIAAEVQAHGGIAGFRAHSLKNLELKTVLKESHCTAISQLCPNTLDSSMYNLFACVGKDQVTVYDDLHMGDYIGVVLHYVNQPSAHHRGGAVTCCAWVQMAGDATRHEGGDACLAVSGPEGVIQAISVAEGRVTQLLKGHTAEVVDLSGCRGVPGLLLSLSSDGSLRLWDVPNGECLACVATDATTAELHPDGSYLLTGHRGGKVCRWPISVSVHKVPQAATCFDTALQQLVLAPCTNTPFGEEGPSSLGDAGCDGGATTLHAEPLTLPSPGRLTHAVDCIRFVSGCRVAAKAVDGSVYVWDQGPSNHHLGGDGDERGCATTSTSASAVSSFRVPASDPNMRCLLAPSLDGAYICAGGGNGDAYVFEAATGALVRRCSCNKVPGSVRSCALSEDCRHLLAIKGNGFLFRFEYMKEMPADVTEAEGGGSDTDAGAGKNTRQRKSLPRASVGPRGKASSVEPSPPADDAMIADPAMAGAAAAADPPTKKARMEDKAPCRDGGAPEDSDGDDDAMEDS